MTTLFTLIAFSESQDEAGAFTRMAAVIDQHVRASGDDFIVPPINQIVGAAAFCGAAVGYEARLVAPSLRRTNPYYITPVEPDIVPTNVPALSLHPESPVPLDVNETLNAENNANPVAAEQHSVLVLLSDGAIAPVTGAIRTINAEITLAQVAGAWSFSALSLPDALPVGEFEVVGARLVAAGAVAFRFVPVGAAHRPGGIAAQGTDDLDPWEMRYGRFGSWFNFNTVNPPGVEVLGSAAAASATYQMYLDILPK